MSIQQAVIKAEPRPGITIGDIPIPKISPDEILIQVKTAGICGTDVHIYEWVPSYKFLSKFMPVVLGHEFSGEVAEVGSQVSIFQPGDRVTSEPGQSCGHCTFCITGKPTLCDQRLSLGRIGLEKNGAMAKYVVCHHSLLHKIPNEVSFEEAAICEPVAVAFNALEQVNIFPGAPVVVLGCGYIGIVLAQGAKIAGASPVIVTGLSQDKDRLTLAKSLAADQIINVEIEDPIEKVMSMTGGLGAAIVFEVSGSTKSFNKGLEMLQKGGDLVVVATYPENITMDVTQKIVREMKTVRGVLGGSKVAWSRALNLMALGKLKVTPLITHRLPLERAEEGFRACIEKKALKVILLP